MRDLVVKDCYVQSGVPESMVAVVPYGVDVDRFNPSGAPFPLATEKGTKLLFVGGTIPRKASTSSCAPTSRHSDPMTTCASW